MSKERLIEFARQVKMPYDFVTGEPLYLEKLEAFASLVRADEREACAKVCDTRAAEYDGFSAEQNASEKLAAAIRARGQA